MIEFNKSDNNKAGIIGRINNEVKSSVGYFRTPTKSIWGKVAYAVVTIIKVIFCMIFAVFAIFGFAMHFIQESFSFIPILLFAMCAIACAHYTVCLILPGKMPIELYRRQKSGMGFRAYRKNTLSNHNDIIRYSDLDGFYRPERSGEV